MATIKAKSEIPRAEFSLRATSRQRPERAVSDQLSCQYPV